MSGYIRQDTGNEIADGNTIEALPLDSEFDAIVAAFSASSGHRHNGTLGEGAPITVVGPAQDLVVSTNSITPKTDNTIDLGAALLEFKDLWIDGTANIDTLAADAGTVGGAAITTISNTQTLTNKTINLADNTLVATSAQIAAAVTDETGTGSLVFSTNPIFAGFPRSPNPPVDTNNTIIATTAYVFAERSNPITLTNKTLTSPVITGATFSSANVTITGGTITGITDLAVADGGTGASDAAGARTNLGLAAVSGTDFLGNASTATALSAVITEAMLPGRLKASTTNITNLTDITETGFYRADPSTTGMPTTESFMLFAVMSGASGAVMAVSTSGDREVWVRNKVGGIWIGGWSQIVGAALASIEGLTTAANQTIYTTGVDTYATTSLTAFGRSLIAAADAAAARTVIGTGTIATQNSASVTITGGSITGITDLAVADGGTGASNAATARTNLGLVIGTDVQAQNVRLQSLSDIGSLVADRMIYTTGTNIFGAAILTSFMRTLLDDADAATARTTLGLGAVSTLASIGTANVTASALVTEAEGLNSSDNDTSWPTTAAVKDYVDTAVAWKYESPEQTITNGSLLTLAHGIGSRPKEVQTVIRCTTAQSPYNVGDEVMVSFDSNTFGPCVGVDATNIKIRSSTNTPRVYDDSGAVISITNSSWRYVVRAR